MNILEVNPKFQILKHGDCLLTRKRISASTKAGVTITDKIFGFDQEFKEIEKNTALIFLEDRQFYSPSRELRKPMSFWVRAQVISPRGELLWVTLCCDSKVSWDFKTYNNKENTIKTNMEEFFKLI